MSKRKIVREMAAASRITMVEAAAAYDQMLLSVRAEVAKGNRVMLRGFGSITKVTTKQRLGTNPKTGGTMIIPSREKAKFKASDSFLDI